jgi:hypothetical protein
MRSDPLQGCMIPGSGYGPEFQETARQIVGVVAMFAFRFQSQSWPRGLCSTDVITALVVRVSSFGLDCANTGEPHSFISPIENEPPANYWRRARRSLARTLCGRNKLRAIPKEPAESRLQPGLAAPQSSIAASEWA